MYLLQRLFGLILVLQGFSYKINNKRFPEDFKIGVSTSAYQIEGGWNEDGKGISIWDTASHTPDFAGGANGDIACDSYHKYKEDIQMIKALGVDYYRFSISWTRILPTGFTNKINQAGVRYYKNLIQEILDNDLEPFVTIYHYDLPQAIQDTGGWPNEYIVKRFEEYARLVFTLFGGQVKNWITINEPKQVCQKGYGSGVKAPLIKSHGLSEFLCAHNVIKAHTAAWHVYNNEFRKEQQGRVGFGIDTMWMEPGSNKEEDIAAAERQIQFTFGWYANPVINGDYPWQMKKYVDERSAVQGFNESRLPKFTHEEIEYIKGSIDFLGINYYTANMVKEKHDTEKTEVSWEADAETIRYYKEEWEYSTSWLRVAPFGIGKLMHWLKKTYGNIPIWITENGVSDDGNTLEDNLRIEYFRKHLSQVRDAMEAGINVIGYTAWNLMDSYEWNSGYEEKFGLYHVDFTSPNRTRTPKKSFEFYRNFAKTRCIVDVSKCINDEMDNIIETIYNTIPI